MKNNLGKAKTNWSWLPIPHVSTHRLILMSIKACYIFALLCCFQLRAETFSQTLSYKANSVRLENLFNYIEKRSDFLVLYDNNVVKRTKPLNLDAKNLSLKSFLELILEDQPLSYVIDDKTIFINAKHAKPAPTTREERLEAKRLDRLQRTIKGRVADEKGQPLVGVSVTEKGTNNGTITNVEGNFELVIGNVQGSLVFSLIGYESIEKPIGQTNEFSIALIPSVNDLDEVVVVGYGVQKKVNLTGAVSAVSGKDIQTRPVGQTSAALQGMAPGVTVTQRSGKPGSDAATIRIRGIGTLSDANPLVLIDGVEGSVNNIDPNLIESISILKDAASSSIYGSRAANGVILVTTKRGTGDRVTLSYNNYFGWQSPTNMPKLVNALDHMLLTNEAYTNVGSSPLYPAAILDAYRAQGDGSSDQYPNTDWQKESLLGSGFQQSHFVTLNAGSNKVRTLASFGYYDQKGLMLNSGFKRYTLRNNLDIEITEKLAAKIDLQYVNPVITSPAQSIDDLFQWMNSLPANQTFRNSNGTWGLGWNGNNPVSAAADGGIATEKGPWGAVNASLIFKPFSWLTAEANYAPKYATTLNKNFREKVQSYHPDGSKSFAVPQRSALTERHTQQLFNNMRATLTFNKSFADHHLSWLLGASREDFHEDMLRGFRDTYILPDYPVLNTGSALNQSAEGTAEEWALQSFFSRINYNFKDRYLLELNARYDGSSRFLKGNRYGFFPSASAGWRFSEEPFMEESKSWLNEGKLRASWGKLGNQNIGPYPAVSALDLGSFNMGNAIVNTAALNNMSNPGITWESTEEQNIGIDLTLFKNFSLTADYFHRKTSDILLKLDIPLTMGLNAPNQNAGIVENRGWEVALNYRSDRNREFRYDLTFNLSDVKNKILDLRGISNTGLLVHREGYAISSILGYEVEGYFQTQEEIDNHAKQFGTLAPGDLKYKDQNADGLINEADKLIIGSTVPRMTYSLNANMMYKGIDFGFLLQGVGKADGYLHGAGIQPFTTTGAIGGTIREDNKDRWTPDNPNAKYPRLAFGQNNNSQSSQFWMKNASYLRVKNVQLGYTLPTTTMDRIGINRLRLFVNGSNLFSFDKFWDGYDVEAPVGTGFFYPQVKVYTFGLDITF
ncbi:SusC/RagA family TonB-linked outer membrane protein [Sphingobacterium sp. DK4209]|uniref:SusC/RagA family TonB-linked outer membrane protein n=2 Tax=Sphingobacterium zhuxiongii TaxID=2662364 RepID=A0A5Q0QBK2_9SPHI|nr:SusC/RagA family TonB-linked outer membrane protein [Sphingobacterium sp. DK4209]QGA26866.1 SusC/RagA family TonB-linked outer membrane protein [Sphingobacterium sp. dk4302]